MLKVLNVFPSETVFERCERRQEKTLEMQNEHQDRQPSKSAPSSFTSSTSAGSKPGLFVFEKLFFIVLMKNRHGSNGKKIPQTDL